MIKRKVLPLKIKRLLNFLMQKSVISPMHILPELFDELWNCFPLSILELNHAVVSHFFYRIMQLFSFNIEINNAVFPLWNYSVFSKLHCRF